MHKATKLVKAEMGGECKFVSELEEGRFLVSSAPKVSDSDSDDIQAVGGIRFFLVEKDFVREAYEREIRMGHHPALMRRLREMETASAHNIYALIEKYYFQKSGESMPSMKPFADGDKDLERQFQEATDWANDGKEVGFRTETEFFRMQIVIFGKILYNQYLK